MSAQENFFVYQDLTMRDVFKLESKLNSPIQSTSNNINGRSKNSQEHSISFLRKASGKFPASIVEYFFSPNDSLIKAVIFEWKIDLDTKQKQADNLRLYNTSFNTLVKAMTKALGKPANDLGKVHEIESPVVGDNSKNYERKVVWKKGSKIITTIFVWAEEHGEQMITSIKEQ